MSMSNWDEGPDPSRDDRERDELDEFVRRFEQAYNLEGEADPAAYLPPQSHPLYAAVLCELVRVDMEYGWERGRPKDLSEYRRDFPALEADREGLREIAFEEFRLRRQAGHEPSPEEYLSRHGVAISSKLRWLLSPAPAAEAYTSMDRSAGGLAVATASLVAMARKVSATAAPRAVPSLPEVGEVFLGFRLVGELGKGSFGRVFLARQGDLADRLVVLKVTTDRRDESQTLAQLRHDNIVPVYSSHRAGALRAVCMPYLGSVTLRDVFDDLKAHGALPDSGQSLLSSLGATSVRQGSRSPCLPPSSSTAAPALDTGGARGFSHAGSDDGPRDPALQGLGGGAETLRMLGALSYVEAVVWMASRLADGLAHAHDQGILHRDMKPANILLTDDGRPMLLDFNLAEDLKRQPAAEAAAIGGTFPYMAPEHLDAFGDGARPVDARSDLYAFGVICFEMLTGRTPFPVYGGSRREVLRRMIADRQGPPPRLRSWNPAVSPAVESVIRRCMEADPKRRYQSAHELAEDLSRHLAHRPLRHTPEPSLRERIVKWLRRHPRLTLLMTVLAACSVLVGSLITSLAARNERLSVHEARAALSRFETRSSAARNLLYARAEDISKRRQGLELAERALGEFGDFREPRAAAFVKLPGDSRSRLLEEAGELLLLVALARERDAEGADPVNRRKGLAEALDASRQAEACYAPMAVPRALWSHRAAILAKLGDHETARETTHRAESTPLRSVRDYALSAWERHIQGHEGEALALFEEATRRDPTLYWAWLGQGLCHEFFGEFEKAESDYNTCTALAPEEPAGWFNQGVVAHKLNKLDRAAVGLERFIKLSPHEKEGYYNRARVALDRGDVESALRDFSHALELDPDWVRIYFARAIARDRFGDCELANRDREEGLRRTPRDEISWVVRGIARANDGNDEGALADYNQAISLNPRSFPAYQNKIHLLSVKHRDTAGALTVLDRMVEIFPDNPGIRADRGLHRARLGLREGALDDALAALEHTPTPPLYYKVAGLYAQTSLVEPSDRGQALSLLSQALRAGYGIDTLAKDRDLDPIRDDAEFQKLAASARSLPAITNLRPATSPAKSKAEGR